MARLASIALVVLAVLGVGGWFLWPYLSSTARPIRVGILHSTTGPIAVNEAAMIEAEKLAIDEINAAGGLLGRKVEAVVVDGQSDPDVYAREAERLIRQEKVSVIFGCYTSASRKGVKPVVERNNHLLVYPVAYEGLEESPNILYTGAAPSQQIIPTITWSREVLGTKTYYLVGNDYVWARSLNTIVKDQLKALGGTVLGEEYVPIGTTRLDDLATKAVGARPDVILSSLIGDSIRPFYEKVRVKDRSAADIPIISFIVSEDALRGLPVHDMVNDYFVCNYLQSLDRPENQTFVQEFRRRYGADRVTCDVIATAYNSVRLWAQAVGEAETAQVEVIRDVVLRQSLDAPEGIIAVDRKSRHTWRPFFIAKVRPDGLVDLVWSVTKAIRPVPYPSSRTEAEWHEFLEGLQRTWGGKWQAPAAAAGTGARTWNDWPGTDAITHFHDRGRLSSSRDMARRGLR